MGLENNPCVLAYSEAQRLWPAVSTPDVFLSLGTGMESSNGTTSRYRNFIFDGFTMRFWRSIKAKHNTEKRWREFRNSIKDSYREDYQRFNPALPSGARIDNAALIPRLRNIVRDDPQWNVFFTHVARFLLISAFYFELDCYPSRQNEDYLVQGAVKCRLPAMNVIQDLESLGIRYVHFSTDIADLTGERSLRQDFCHTCSRYICPVQFFVKHPSDSICISLKTTSNIRRKISGCPHPISWFIDQQGLTPDHGDFETSRRVGLECPACSPPKRQAFGKRDSTGRGSPVIQKPNKRQRYGSSKYP